MPCPTRCAPSASTQARTLCGAGQLAAVRHREQTGSAGDPERRLEVLGPAPALVVAQAEADDPASCVLRGEARQGAGLQRVLGAVRPDHDADPHAGVRRRVRRGVEHELGEGRHPAEQPRVPARVDLDLQPAGPVGPLVGGHLAQQPADVVLALKHRAGGVVQPLEPEPAPLVRAQVQRVVRGERLGQPHAVLGGQVEQGRTPHGAGEVQVQVGLREPPQVAAGQARASAMSRWMRLTPSTRSSSPRAYDSRK